MKGEAAAITASAPETFIVLKKNHALDDRIRLEWERGSQGSDVQILDYPLHDTQVEHHLHEGNEEDYGSQNVGEKPLLIDDGVFIEEEYGTGSGLLQKVRSQERKPLEDFEAGVGLEDKEGNGLLEEETDNDGSPVNMPNSRSDVVPAVMPIQVIGAVIQKETHHGTRERL